MQPDCASIRWDRGAAAAAAHALVRTISARDWDGAPDGPPAEVEEEEFASLVGSLAERAGLAVEHVQVFEEDLDRLLGCGAPFLWAPRSKEEHVYVVGRSAWRHLEFLTPAGESARIDKAVAHAWFEASAVREAQSLAARLLLDVPIGDQGTLTRVLRDELAESRTLGFAYLFRPDVQEPLSRVLARQRLGPSIALLVGYAALQSLLTILGWAVIGKVALSGHAEVGSLVGWALLSLSGIVVQIASTRLVGRMSLRAATSLRERLLAAALALDPDRLSSLGIGGLVVVAGQADALVTSSISLFLSGIIALTGILSALAVLAAAPLPGISLGIFVAFLLLVLALAPALFVRFDALQKKRTRLTTDMVERMVGHRTRLVQETPEMWHAGEDEAVHDYAQESSAIDRRLTFGRALPRAYYALSLVVVFFVLVTEPTQQALALSLGGLTLGMAALASVFEVLATMGGSYAMWNAVAPFVWDHAGTEHSRGADVESTGGGPVLELRGVNLSYPGRSHRVLRDADFAIHHGDRVLVEGPSGGGKTTLAALLAGLRKPTAGLVLLRGLDHHIVKARDRARVVASAPQFYKNHIFTNTLAFNLLLGRAWPASNADLREAEHVARALGLGPLIDRMPAALHQHVGATGWQLSHGEQSRVYLARALLQRSQVTIMDETFDALDPATLEQCMKVALERSQTLIVVTHR